MFISIDGITNEGLVNLVPKTFVKPYAGNEIMFEINLKDKINEIILQTYPCGGLNRLKVYSRKS
jgi:allantoicase